jgi:hypothetical protein
MLVRIPLVCSSYHGVTSDTLPNTRANKSRQCPPPLEMAIERFVKTLKTLEHSTQRNLECLSHTLTWKKDAKFELG